MYVHVFIYCASKNSGDNPLLGIQNPTAFFQLYIIPVYF